MNLIVPSFSPGFEREDEEEMVVVPLVVEGVGPVVSVIFTSLEEGLVGDFPTAFLDLWT